MRITLLQWFLVCALAGISWARDGKAQQLLDQRITLSVESQNVKKVLHQIEKQVDARFVFSSQIIQSDRKISVKSQSEPLSQVLIKLLKPLQLAYEVSGNMIIIRPDRPAKSAPVDVDQASIVAPVEQIARSVSGTVSDQTGVTLPGVNVVIKGTQKGTTTDAQGQFKLELPDTEITLVFSSVGYLPKEITVGNETMLTVTLTVDTKALGEVVVVGYGTQKRADVTAAIASVPMGEIRDMPVSNVATALQGKIPGVVIQQTSGAPGSTPAIKVRGFGSISAGTSPLIVIDGNIVGSGVFGLLSSVDIESIDVLKDASSTAIYGSKGSNGVLLVTTKRGKPGRMNVNLDVYTGFQEITKKIDLLNSQQYAEFAKEASNTAYLDNVPGASATDPNSVRPASYLRYRYPRGDLFDWFNYDDPVKVANLPYTDFQNLIFRRAKMSSYQLSVSGGNEKARYLVSGSYLKQDGIILKSSLDRYIFRANVEVNLLPKLKVGMNLNPSFKNVQEVTAENQWFNQGIITAALAAIPMAPVYAADGSYSSELALAAPYNLPGVTNPLANITEYNSPYQSGNLLGNIYADYGFLKNFNYRASANVNFNDNRRNTYRTSRMPLSNLLPPTTATGTVYSDQSLSWLFNQVVGYTKNINSVHNIEALVGMEATSTKFQSSSASGSSYANDVVETLNASASGSTTTAWSFKTANASVSYFARANYNYKGKYLANLSVRRDGSSIFGPDNRWGTFPAGSLGWRVSEESFMKNIRAISETKLRVSYGLSGNNAFSDNYPYVGQLRTDNYSFNNNLVNGLAPSSLANSKLGWEKNQQFDAGLDVGLVNNRIYLSVDYYHRITKDLLLSVNVPSLTGFTSAYKNIGKMENKGMEFALNTRNTTKGFIWNTTLNLSFNRNKVLELGPTGDPIRTASGSLADLTITQIGAPIGSFYGYKQLGIFQNQADLDANPHDVTSRPGDVKYADIDGDGKITANDRTILGNNQPDFLYGFTNSFSYKGFDLNISIQGTQGDKILNIGRRYFDNMEGNQNQMTTALHRWRSASDPGDGITPRANERSTGNNNAVSSRWVEDASYVRIQNVNLGYRLPTKLLNKIKIQQLRLYVSAQNLYTWTKYLNYNPEVSNYESPLSAGIDYGAYPLARTFTFGINVGF
ncbi:SusC/RagA family TonB-linked outer membrane protein [Spirosoma sp. HMF3257]|uniref:SusC/RagA family TonB-linked outer membrane protein n=1 Tax=Spirosoma telluris TaxID=2183553 RepID=A0A327NEM4_9BACT|nr:SusC/RagA family TonB-linked outer membrane protein [Spirosoma telluris]RAI73375.1 SusC/RagA family TonB-linked outer membrane protein [Spirosoma telluris]